MEQDDEGASAMAMATFESSNKPFAKSELDSDTNGLVESYF